MRMDWKWTVPYDEFKSGTNLANPENSSHGLQEPTPPGTAPCSFLRGLESPAVLAVPHFAPATLASWMFLRHPKVLPLWSLSTNDSLPMNPICTVRISCGLGVASRGGNIFYISHIPSESSEIILVDNCWIWVMGPCSPSHCALKRNEGRASPVTAIRSRLEEHQSITPQQILHFAHKHTNWDISIWKAVLVNLKDTCKLKNIKFILKNTRKRVCIGIHFAMHINNKNTCSTFYLSQLNFWPTWSPQKGKIPGPQSAEPGTWQANMCNVHPRLDPPDSRQRLVNKGAPTRRKIKGLLLSDDLSESSRLLICSLSS